MDQAPLRAAAYAWLDAFVTAAAGLLAIIVVASLGLWSAGATDLPSGALPRVVAATVVIAAGGIYGSWSGSVRCGGLAPASSEA